MPFARTLSLDMDAVACSADSIARVFRAADREEDRGGPLALVNQEWVDHARVEAPARRVTTLRSNVPVTIPVPKDTLQRLEAGDVCEHTWHRGVGVAEADTKRCDATRSIKLNMGFCLFRRDEARPIFEGWAACVGAGLARPRDQFLYDQYCFNAAVTANASAAIGALSTFNVCRVVAQGTCFNPGSACWFHHSRNWWKKHHAFGGGGVV